MYLVHKGSKSLPNTFNTVTLMLFYFFVFSCGETKGPLIEDEYKPWLNDAHSNDTDTPQDTGQTNEPSTEDSSDTDTGQPNTDHDGDGYYPPEDCDDNDDWVIPQTDLLALPLYRCGTGQILQSIESSFDWVIGDSAFASGSLSENTGCIGQSLQFDYSFTAQANESSWVEATHSFPPVDIGGKDFLLLPLFGDPSAIASDITLSIGDTSCVGHYHLPEASGLGAWRTLIVPIQRFSGQGCAPNPTAIESLTLRVSNTGSSHSGSMYIDDVTAITSDELTPDIRTRFCPPVESSPQKALLAEAILHGSQTALVQNGHPFSETWTGHSDIGMYGAALSLITLSLEYSRTGDLEYKEAATTMAEGFLALDRHESGVWYEFYNSDLSSSSTDIPRVRHVSWVVIALHQYILHVQPEDPIGYQLAMTGASDWLRVQQQTFSTDYPQWGGGLSRATEDNIAAYFAFTATAEEVPTNLAGSAVIGIGQFLWSKIWDVNQLRLRSGVNDGGFSSTVAGWGTAFLVHHNHPREAIFNLAFAGGFLAIPSWDETEKGYALSDGPFQPSWEATGIMAANGGPNALPYLQGRLNSYSGGLLEGTPDSYLEPEQALTGIQPTAWAYLGLHGDFLSKE